ncbi:MAG: hypothetical protein OEZ10_04030 [Gammaproteobacteria bacterium]|nr:hypothetical protein [Gammaproteobacteria bacterium]
MRLSKYIVLSLFFLIISEVLADDVESKVKKWVEEQSIKKQLVILQSTKNYNEALRTAKLASKTLKLKLDLRGLDHNDATGLTFSKEVCDGEGGFGYPCYIARGRYDDGDYVSIEHSSAYSEFSNGFFIVVASSHPKGSNEVTSVLELTRKHFKDSYAKTSMVYMGCMH